MPRIVGSVGKIGIVGSTGIVGEDGELWTGYNCDKEKNYKI